MLQPFIGYVRLFFRRLVYRRRKNRAPAIFCGRCFALAFGTLAVFCIAPQAARANDNQIGLVVVHGNGEVLTRCISFTEPQLTGYEVLQRSGLDLNVEPSGGGAAICRLDGEGCTYPEQPCFCGTEGGEYRYWSYWNLVEGQWVYSNLGAAFSQVQPGAVEGWIWGSSTPSYAPSPPIIDFADICAEPTATPTAEPSATLPPPTATPSPTPTHTSTIAPTPTPTPTPTPVPTLTPIPTATWTAIPIWTALPTPLPTDVQTVPATATPTASPTETPSPIAVSLLPTSAPMPLSTLPPAPTASPIPPQIVRFNANPLGIMQGEQTRLDWQVSQAESVSVSDGQRVAVIAAQGEGWVQPEQTTTYVLTASSAGIQVVATVVVQVVTPVPAPTYTATPIAAPVAPPPAPPSLPEMKPSQVDLPAQPALSPPVVTDGGVQMQLLLLVVFAGVLAAIPLGILCLVAVLVIIRQF